MTIAYGWHRRIITPIAAVALAVREKQIGRRAGLLFIAFGFLAGWLFGGPDDTRRGSRIPRVPNTWSTLSKFTIEMSKISSTRLMLESRHAPG